MMIFPLFLYFFNFLNFLPLFPGAIIDDAAAVRRIITSVCPRNYNPTFPPVVVKNKVTVFFLQGYNFLVSMHRRVVHWHAFVILGRVDGVRGLGGREAGSESTVKNVDDEHQAEQGEYRDQDDRHCAPSFALVVTAVRRAVTFRRRDRANRTTSSRFRGQRIVAGYRANSLFAAKLPSGVAGARGA